MAQIHCLWSSCNFDSWKCLFSMYCFRNSVNLGVCLGTISSLGALEFGQVYILVKFLFYCCGRWNALVRSWKSIVEKTEFFFSLRRLIRIIFRRSEVLHQMTSRHHTQIKNALYQHPVPHQHLQDQLRRGDPKQQHLQGGKLSYKEWVGCWGNLNYHVMLSNYAA